MARRTDVKLSASLLNYHIGIEENVQVENKMNWKIIRVIKNIMIIFAGVTVLAGILSFVAYKSVNGVVDDNVIYIELIQEISKRDVALVPGTAVGDNSVGVKCEDRLNAALELYESGLVEKILISGSPKEALQMAKYATRHGVSKEHIEIDAHGLDTYQTIARAMEKYPEQTYYLCTQELYAPRSLYLMKKIGMDGEVVCVDVRFYEEEGKSRVREYFAATKAVLDANLRRGKASPSLKKYDFEEVTDPQVQEKYIMAPSVETEVAEVLGEEYKVTDVNKKDEYDVQKAVEYARTYAEKENPEYPCFENNCTNFVSQCLNAGGLKMQGVVEEKGDKRLEISTDAEAWFSYSVSDEKTGRRKYQTSQNFIRSKEFVQYFTEVLGYKMSIYENEHAGKKACYEKVSSGDVCVIFDQEHEIQHIGIVTAIGNGNVFFCANSRNRKDFSMFILNRAVYAKIGLIHMSQHD